MARSDEAEGWFNAVYEAVQQVPPGRVTSYGHIALLLEQPQRARQVGVCLKHLPSDATQHFHHDNVPWQRVINAKGEISPRGPGAAERQAERLQAEGIEVTQGPLGEYQVSFEGYGWFPTQLPRPID